MLNLTMKLLKNNKNKKNAERVQSLQNKYQPLGAMLDAFEARLKSNQTLEERLRAYMNPQLEQNGQKR